MKKARPPRFRLAPAHQLSGLNERREGRSFLYKCCLSNDPCLQGFIHCCPPKNISKKIQSSLGLMLGLGRACAPPRTKEQARRWRSLNSAMKLLVARVTQTEVSSIEFAVVEENTSKTVVDVHREGLMCLHMLM
jgi:hypothetical protein